MLKLIVSIYISIMSFCLFSQLFDRDTTQLNFQTGFSIEIHNSRYYGISLGGIVGENIGDKMKPNSFLGLYFDVVLVNEPIVAPRLKITLNHNRFIGVNFNFANYYRNGLNDFRITPEINFSLFGQINVFAGYNFMVSKNKFDEIGQFRVGLNVNLTH